MDKKDPKKAAIELAKSYDEDVSINLPLAWNWDARYSFALEWVFDFAIVTKALDCKVGDLILDFVSGSCWITEWLNRLGYRTVSLDISTNLLGYGMKRMKCDSRINLKDFPAYFVAGDGESLPFADGVFDGIVCMNSLHHMPDYQKVVNEMFRILKPSGRVVFSEPGKNHSKISQSAREVEEYGVLEKDVVLSEVYTMAMNAGFRDLHIKPYVYPGRVEYNYYDWQRLANRMPAATEKFIGEFVNAVDEHLIFVLDKSKEKFIDSRLPNLLKAEIEITGLPDSVRPVQEIEVKARVKNIGDTVWMANPTKFGGYVRLGIKLLDLNKIFIRDDLERTLLPKDIYPGEEVELNVRFSAPKEIGSYCLKFDMVDEVIAWFESRGSTLIAKPIDVTCAPIDEKEFILSFFKNEENPYRLTYIDAHLKRWISTLKIIPAGEKGMKLLELGSIKEFAVLLMKYTNYECYFQNLFQLPKSVLELHSDLTGDSYQYEVVSYNLEAQPFPVADESFDVVLCCEVLEHLGKDPMFMFKEINRVLTRGGRLVLSTPNVCRLSAIEAALNGYTPLIYPIFKKESTPDRHNREYTPNEVRTFLEKGGFKIEYIQTEDSWNMQNEEIIDLLKNLNKPIDLRGENIFIIASKETSIIERYPIEFYE